MEIANTLTGRCHCGGISWQFEGKPSEATICNCTVCRRYGVLWAYGHEEEGIRVTGETKAYRPGRHIAFHFCAGCGCVGYWRAVDTDPTGRRRMAVNLRMAEPEMVAQVPIDRFDGLHTFEGHARDGRCVGDYWF
ncbi:GFA family protein [Salinicola sp. V024]|uniref:GFA family protein n=1 Tax=Salinicola TaxID=404432 RepID=UPI003F45CD22